MIEVVPEPSWLGRACSPLPRAVEAAPVSTRILLARGVAEVIGHAADTTASRVAIRARYADGHVVTVRATLAEVVAMRDAAAG